MLLDVFAKLLVLREPWNLVEGNAVQFTVQIIWYREKQEHCMSVWNLWMVGHWHRPWVKEHMASKYIFCSFRLYFYI
ncbi:hypothetical protein C0J52_27689 [Blattella germanica]|nr:hypothetical protein C0J52_27689 [Blattella germanica]